MNFRVILWLEIVRLRESVGSWLAILSYGVMPSLFVWLVIPFFKAGLLDGGLYTPEEAYVYTVAFTFWVFLNESIVASNNGISSAAWYLSQGLVRRQWVWLVFLARAGLLAVITFLVLVAIFLIVFHSPLILVGLLYDSMLALVLLFLTVFILTSAACSLNTIITIYFKWVSKFTQALMRIVFFTSPILWSPSHLTPSKAQFVSMMEFNPLFVVFSQVHGMLDYRFLEKLFNEWYLGFFLLISLVLIIGTMKIFKNGSNLMIRVR